MEEEPYKKVEVVYKYYLPDNHSELKMAQISGSMYSALWDIDSYCRDILKHGLETPRDEALEYIRNLCSETDIFSIP